MFRFTLIAASLAALLAGPAVALESAAVRSDRITATLVSDSDQVQPGVPLRIGLRLRIAPGWHTYWTNPGDAGAPPDLSWTLSSGSSAGAIVWPTPLRLPEGPVMTYGYTGEVLFPATITPGPGGLEVEAKASWLVCERICVPEEGTFRMSLPPGVPAPSAEIPLFTAVDRRLPRPSPFEASVAPDGVLTLAGPGLSATTVKDAWFFPAQWGLVEQAVAQPVSVEDGAVHLGLRPGPSFKPDTALVGTVVLRDPGGQESYLDISAAHRAAPMAAPLWQTLLLAVAGGLLLNLMPCVFPILAMKAVALARLSAASRTEIRANAASYTAGVLAAFFALGITLLVLRSAGAAAGWGFQFQSPLFVTAMVWLMFGLGLNLSGVFELGSGLAGTGQTLAGRGGHAGSFFTGLLAVVVATPCTAPFMAAALAAALTATTAATLSIFLALGIGLAAPYALLGLFPRAARLLPRPGPWMGVLKGALAFPMYGAAAWLIWVVSLQSGSSGVLAAAAGITLIGFAGWSHGLAQRSGRRIGTALALCAVLGASALLPASNGTAATATAEAGTEPFSPGRLAVLREERRAVFVNMTAAWCVTCLVNERLALSPKPVRDAFAAGRVAYLKGDWTRGDPAITAFLRQHARDGVPLYVFYPADGGPPTILPQILTEADMLSRLQPTLIR